MLFEILKGILNCSVDSVVANAEGSVDEVLFRVFKYGFLRHCY